MALKYKAKTAKIVEDDHFEIELHGLSLNDITQLVMINRSAIETLFDQVSGRDVSDIGDREVRGVMMDAVENAPALVAHVIALSAKALDEYDTIAELPIGLQIECLVKIGELTFTREFTPKKALALVVSKARSQGKSPQA